MNKQEKVSHIEGSVSPLFNAYEIACIGSHVNTLVDAINVLIERVDNLEKIMEAENETN